LLFDLEETPGRVQGPPLVPGQDTRTILQGLGYEDDRIDKLIADAAVSESDSFF
jgi:crotonobetainyl-CoA:carnitine CoA-transferase CaiB-like acyl-CoA transferase